MSPLQMVGEAGVAADDGVGRLVEHTLLVELDGRHDEAFGPHVGGVHGQAARHRAADIVVMAEDLAEADQPALVEDRDRGAEIWHVPDAAGAVVGVVPEEDIAVLDIVGAEVVEHRLHQRRVGAPGELAALRVEERDAVVVLIADHGRARGALHRRLDLELRRADGAGDDLELDRPQGSRCIPLRHRTFSMTRLP